MAFLLPAATIACDQRDSRQSGIAQPPATLNRPAAPTTAPGAPNARDVAQPAAEVQHAHPSTRVLEGNAAMKGWETDAPGVRRLIRPGDLPPPYATRSVDNGPRMVARPDGAWPKVPPGFNVEEYATGLNNPRTVMTAPNGDLFVVESEPGRIRVLRDGPNGKPLDSEYAHGLYKPFGLAWYPPGPNPQCLYVADNDAVLRFPYHNGDLAASGPPQVVVPHLPGGGHLRGGGHWTRDIDFSHDGQRMFISVGSFSNDWENERVDESRRADILEFNPDGSGERVYASGIRNAVGVSINPTTGELWASVNERDGLGDNLPPDYITRVKEGGFYGWPWYYIGGNQDPRHPGERPDLRNQVLIPDVLVGCHYASLKMAFYTGKQFPTEYFGDAFASEHGSWNRSPRVGYKVIRVLLHNGQPTGVFEDFMTGFVTSEGNVWGRPVGVTVAHDGSVIVSDDGSGTLWRISYVGSKTGQ